MCELTPGGKELEKKWDTQLAATFILRNSRPDAPLPDWLSAADLDFYASEFTRTGFTGGLNWYRNMDRNWATTEPTTIAVPALFIGGRADPVLGFTRTDRAREVVTGPYREEWLDGAGHWIPQDHAADVNRILLEFLEFCGW